MTLKELIDKIQFIALFKNEKKNDPNLFRKFKMIAILQFYSFLL